MTDHSSDDELTIDALAHAPDTATTGRRRKRVYSTDERPPDVSIRRRYDSYALLVLVSAIATFV